MVRPSEDRDGAPVAFQCDGRLHRIVHAVGPERIAGAGGRATTRPGTTSTSKTNRGGGGGFSACWKRSSGTCTGTSNEESDEGMKQRNDGGVEDHASLSPSSLRAFVAPSLPIRHARISQPQTPRSPARPVGHGPGRSSLRRARRDDQLLLPAGRVSPGRVGLPRRRRWATARSRSRTVTRWPASSAAYDAARQVVEQGRRRRRS